MPSMVVPACNLSYFAGGGRRIEVQGQAGKNPIPFLKKQKLN
jgi:hypothetical protein